MSAEIAKNGLRAPVNVTWEMTLKCNLRCAHCLSDSGSALPDELNYDECCRFIDQLTDMNVFQVNIGGGEPFSREDFVDLLDYAHKKGLVTCVSTNGTLVDDGLAKKLSRLKMLYLQVSLDGSTPQVNDAIRGKGTYKKIMIAMECLTRHQIPFSINTVLTRMNYGQLEDLRKIAHGFGSEMRVSRFRPSGRAKKNMAVLAPEKQQLENFADWLSDHDLVRTGDSFFCLTSEHRRRKGLDMCGAAKMTCCVSPTGNVYPCAFLQEEPFCVGNIRHDGFQDLWDNAPVFQNLRSLHVSTCMNCDRFDVCRGGCPAMAYHTYRRIDMPDPECLVNLKKLAS
jgi:mycofactocin radical SAM maturase